MSDKLVLLPVGVITSAQEANEAHGRIVGFCRMTVDAAIAMGEFLERQKASLEHGEWLPWIKANLKFSERVCRDYMSFWRNRDKLKSANVADLTEARRLLATLPQFRNHSSELGEMEVHELNIFPSMTDTEFLALAYDIKEHGLDEPIITFQGQILDGKERYRACLLVGIEPRFKEFNENKNPLDYVC